MRKKWEIQVQISINWGGFQKVKTNGSLGWGGQEQLEIGLQISENIELWRLQFGRGEYREEAMRDGVTNGLTSRGMGCSRLSLTNW